MCCYFDFFYNNFILFNKILDFKFYFSNYLTGFFTENHFKILRLHNGLYRQRYSYMYRIGINYGIIYTKQLVLISYISFKYDKKYFHFTTRTNIQFNWLKFLEIFNIIEKLLCSCLHSIQTSGNCIRNITNSYYYNNFIINVNVWSEILRQWFNLNSEFLFLPRKFKISVLHYKKDFINFRIHDLGVYINKNNLNKIIFNIYMGGGLGRTPLLGVFFFKNINWKNFINYCDKILRIYNIYGFRNNIYKSRIKILLKSIDNFNFYYFFYKEFNFSNNLIYLLNEKEINLFYKNYKKNNYYYNILINFNKKIKFNYFFLSWFKFNVFFNIFFLPIKNNNKPTGDLNHYQIKILYFFLINFFNINFFNITSRQNLSFFTFSNIYFFYNILKKYFFNIYNFNLITDIITCPGKDFCSLANSKSIFLSTLIQNLFNDFNTLIKLRNIYLNISGCINSCAHHHISNIGFLGVSKFNNNYYQIYIGGNFYNYNSLKFSKVIHSSVIYFKIKYFLINIIKRYIIFLIKYEINIDFIDFYNNIGYFNFKLYRY